jgi:cell wall-associated NlpC family hydrolase
MHSEQAGQAEQRIQAERPWRDEDDELYADSQPEEVAALPETDARDIPPDEGDEEPEEVLESVPDVEPDEPVEGERAVTGSVSGLSKQNRNQARRSAVKAAVIGLNHAPELRYTQAAGPRWEGISKSLRSAHGKFPRNADCSSFATWCLWNGLKARYGVRDTVNNQNWRAGYTGTMHNCGKRVVHTENMLLGDLVLYGKVGQPRTHHVAIHVGDGWVISFGSDPGPFKLRWNYRSDVLAIRRYI